MGRFGRLGGVLAVVAALAACSSLGGGGGGPSAVRALDSIEDDIAGAVLAFDVPTALEPIPDASIVAFKLSAQGGDSRRVDALLVPADAADVMGSLPPPSAGRTYYVFAFSPKDQSRLRDAQAWARARPAGTVGMQIDLLPQLCAIEPIDPAGTRFSILVTLPGAGRLAPLVNAIPVADLLKAAGRAALPACAGHSG